MESQRSFLIIGLALVTFLLWQAWQKDYGPQPINPVQQEQTQQANQGVPSFDEAQSEDVPTSDSVPAAQAIAQTQNTNRIIEVKTDTLDVRIDLLGGDVISANLIKFPVTQGSDEPYSLLRSGMGLYVAQSGLIGKQGPDASATGRPVYTAQQSAYQLNGDTLVVPLTWKNSQGLSITKTFTFTQGHYDVNVSYDVQNATSTAANVQPYAQLKQVMDFEDDGNMFMPTYRGAAFSTEDDRYDKYSFDEIEDENLRKTTKAGWVGMLEHYFVSAWVPSQEQTNTLYSRNINNQFAVIGVLSPAETINAGETKTIASTLYMGPKDQDNLAKIARGLDLTVDYGILFWISQPLFSLLTFLHSLVNNWGIAIILITIVVKGAMYWLTKKQYESMARMRNLAPKMQQLKDRIIKARGTIANISSKMGSSDDNSSGGTYAYRAAKAGLIIISKSMAIDLQPLGVSVITLHPGWVTTDMTHQSGLIDVQTSVAGMTKVIENRTQYELGQFVAFDGKVIPF